MLATCARKNARRLFLNAGSKEYVATGTDARFGPTTLYTNSKPKGRLVITIIGGGTKTVMLKISARTGLK